MFLHIFSIEAHLMAAADARRALSRWPRLAPAMEGPDRRMARRALPGFHRLDLTPFGAVLDLAVMDAGQALDQWTGQADAWLLDGFSPALNPAMWTPDLMKAVAAPQQTQAPRAASFTVAGAVRRALADAGFSVEKRPGFGRKRERLEATLPGARPPEPPAPSVAVIGAGIAGLSVMRALRDLGVEPVQFDPAGPGSGASGNPAALVTPAFDAGGGRPAHSFYAQAPPALRLICTARIPDAVIARGAVQREAAERDSARFDRIANSPLFHSLTRMPGGMMLADALTVDPARIAAEWGRGVVGQSLRSLDELAAFDAVVLAAGADIRALWSDAPLQSVRGQASWVCDVDAPVATAFGGYAIPTRTGVLFGATHDRDDEDESVRPQDHLRNLDLLAKGFPDLAPGSPVWRSKAAHAGVRRRRTGCQWPGARPGARACSCWAAWGRADSAPRHCSPTMWRR